MSALEAENRLTRKGGLVLVNIATGLGLLLWLHTGLGFMMR